MRGFGRFAALSLLAIVIIGFGYAALFRSAADRHAIVVSALIALVVQLFTFVALRIADPKKLFTMWGLGAVVRVVTLVVYALVFVRPRGLPPTAALLSLATFLFVTTILESRSLPV